MKRKVGIIGAGASGVMAAIRAAELGAEVTLYEHKIPGKKILVTGNGKCNLGNMLMTKECYYSSEIERVEKCLNQFGVKETISFFDEIGLCIKEKNGYLYPLAEQASVVVKVLMNRLNQLKVSIVEEKVILVDTVKNKRQGKAVTVVSEAGRCYYDAVIIACGSKASPKTGSDGSGYEIAKKLGHKLKPVLPALVQLRCSDKFCKELAGIRAESRIHIFDGKKEITMEEGELQLTDYGISGIPVFQLSGLVNRYLYQNKNASLTARINFFPQFTDKEFAMLCDKRLRNKDDISMEELFYGLHNQKLIKMLLRKVGLKSDNKLKEVDIKKIDRFFEECRNLEMHIVESNGYENAQVCTGGVNLKEVSDDLESKLAPNIYFAGEILDVDGRCGGYNLQWAWTSGFIAGEAAAGKKI